MDISPDMAVQSSSQQHSEAVASPLPVPVMDRKFGSRVRVWLDGRLGIIGHLIILAVILIAPCWLFGIQRLPAWIFAESKITTYVHQQLPYRLHSDDYLYIGNSRNFSRTIDQLFMPHNTHICPTWRLINYLVIASAGDLVHVPQRLAVVAYIGLVFGMLVTGHFISHESGSMFLGFIGMVLMGITSHQWLSTVWYSAGQTIWAGAFIILTLIAAQEILRRNWNWAWPVVLILCWAAGGVWTIGHASGPVTAIYILVVTRGKKRFLALLPFLATILAIIAFWELGSTHINSKIAFHGRTLEESTNPVRAVVNTCHSILEETMLGTFGIYSMATDLQAFILLFAIIFLWYWWHHIHQQPINALEWTGGAILFSSNLVEWYFRGYLPWYSLKNTLLWYYSIPVIGWALFATGWCQAVSRRASPSVASGSLFGKIWMKRREALAVLFSLLMMMVLHQSEVDRMLIETMPPLTTYETSNRMFPIKSLQRLRAVYLWENRVKWQRMHLAKLQQAETIAKNRHWSVEDINAAFGRVRLPLIPEVYDGALMMDLPLSSQNKANPAEVQQVLGQLLTLEPEPTPEWLIGSPELWPPDGWETKP